MIYADYIHTKQVNLNLSELKQYCLQLEKSIITRFGESSTLSKDLSAPVTTLLYAKYNIFCFPNKELYKLFREIQILFRRDLGKTGMYYIQGWINVYNKGQYIDWHKHWDSSKNTYHGFLCVDVGSSITTYHIPGVLEQVDIPGINNNLIISPSKDDMHRTYPWTEDSPRITIAYDIIPADVLQSMYNPFDPSSTWYHWVPI